MGQKSLPKLASENLKFQTISVKLQRFRIISVQKSVPHQSKEKTAVWKHFHSVSRILDFWMGFLFLSQKNSPVKVHLAKLISDTSANFPIYLVILG